EDQTSQQDYLALTERFAHPVRSKPSRFVLPRKSNSVVGDLNRKLKRQWRDYRTAAGGRPVKSSLDELTDEEVAAVVAGMKEIAAEGLPAAKHLRGDIYEVRADASTRSFRLLFATEGRWSQVLLSLSLFEKRTQRAPQNEIDLAQRRLADWRRRGAAMRKAKKQES